MKASIFQNFVQRTEDKSLIVIAKSIQEGKYKDQVEAIRILIAEGNQEGADDLKKKLPAFTPSGIFHNGRKADLLTEYSGYIILDIDKITQKQILEVLEKVRLIPHTFAAFISPSGNGVKIIATVSSTGEHHKIAFAQVSKYYATILHIGIDPSGKDICRLCFMSYDPDCFRNIKATPFQVLMKVSLATTGITQTYTPLAPLPAKTGRQTTNETWDEAFSKCLAFTQLKSNYENGNRNNFIHLLACNCNRAGIPEDFALYIIRNTFDLDPKEIKATVESTYLLHKSEFAQFAQFASDSYLQNDQLSTDDNLLNMPTLPGSIFDKLPAILQEGCNVFKSPRERDIFVTGALTILSGCFTSVEGTYDQKTVYPNLNCFIIAPAASGKGALVQAKALGQAYHNKLLNESLEKKRHYETALQQFKFNTRNRKAKESTGDDQEPQAPPFKILFIPGNSSSAAVIRHLMDGEEKGVFCETEADTMGNSFKQDWGGYSDLLRKAFHHETISYSRKTNNEYFEIKKPRLSVALSGTPSQVQSLIGSAEDGLFSRFIFYTFMVKAEWRNVSPKVGRLNLTKHFEGLSDQVKEMIEFLEDYPSEFNLTESQWQFLDEHFKDWLQEVSVFVSQEAGSTVKRLGLILFRLAMVLTAIRKFENGDISREIICEDADFDTAFRLAETYKYHALYMFSRLPKSESITDKKIRQFFDALPKSFQRKEAVTIGKSINILERTVDKYLAALTGGSFLTQPEYGQYEKA